MTNHTSTHKQFLSADYLSRHLLMKYSAEVSGGRAIWGDEQIDEDFRELAKRLGYSVQKIGSEVRGDAAYNAMAAE